jgi:hypothetical protein
VPAAGAAFFFGPIAPVLNCVGGGPAAPCSPGTDAKPPDALCLATSLTVAIKTCYGEAALYTIAPVLPADKWECVGLPFDLKANSFQAGWVCAGAIAKDKLGNRGVSPPIRLWYDPSQTAQGWQPLPSGIPAAPSCTGTLVKATGKVDGTIPCTYRPAGVAFPQRFAQNTALIP